MRNLVASKKAKGKKICFNGKKVTVFCTSMHGDWIIDIQKIPGDSQIVKRNKAKQEVTSQHLRPCFEDLPDVVIENTLSFLFCSENTDWREAIHDFNSILCLSKVTRERLSASIFPTMSFSVNLLNSSCPEFSFHALVALSKSRIKLDALQVNAGYNDFDLLATLCCDYFDTSRIKCLKIKLPPRPVPSRYLQPACQHIQDTHGSIVPTRPEGVYGIEHCIQIPPEYAGICSSRFHSLDNFQLLTTLRTSLLFNPRIWDDRNNCIFQLPLLRSLDLNLAFICTPRADTACGGLQVLSEVITRMKNLEELALRACGIQSARCGIAFIKYFALRSEVLRIARFRELPKGFFLRECVCPKLELFTCRGGYYGNGVRPDDPAMLENIGFAREKEDYTAGSQNFFGMVVPSDCDVSFRGYGC